MEVTLLGTGSADGWPNPFCTCATCTDARARRDIRGQTAALVDDRLLLDCGPEVPRAAAHLGRALDTVTAVLLTHAHPDHVGPAALLFRRWARRREPLTVVGPPAALQMCHAWVGPDDPVVWCEVGHGVELDVAGYRVRALAAEHDGPEYGPAVVYEVTDEAGTRLLYLTDTGPLPTATLDALSAAKAHLALVEETFGDTLDHSTDHLDLVTFPALVAALRSRGALDPAGRVVAVHLSHHNPPLAQLRARLAECGAEVVSDGARLHVSSTGVVDMSYPEAGEPRRTLVLGGARSGKSSYAEGVAVHHRHVQYVATARVPTDDPEMQQRIATHRGRRPTTWSTVETDDVTTVLRDAGTDDVLLVDCMTSWLAARLDEGGWDDDGGWLGSAGVLRKQIDDLVLAWAHTSARVIGVSNEVGGGIVPATDSGRLFRDLQGRLNAELAARSDDVVLVVAGRPLPLATIAIPTLAVNAQPRGVR